MAPLAAFTVPQEYGYVILATAGTFFLGTWHGIRVGSFRKAVGPEVKYPKAYADSYDIQNAATAEKKHNMYLFNCAQRAHYNYLENHPSVAIAMLVAGLRLPVATAIAGAFWMVSRWIYATGYTRVDKKDGSGRLIGSGFWLAQLALFGMTGWTGYKLLTGN